MNVPLLNEINTQGSSKAMEGYGMEKMIAELKKDNMTISHFIIDGDSSSKKSLQVPTITAT